MNITRATAALSKWTILLVVVVVVLLLLVYGLYQTQYSQYNALASRYNSLVTVYSDLNGNYDSLSKNNSLLMNKYNYALAQLNQSEQEYNNLLGNYTRERIVYQQPATNASIVIWNIGQMIPPSKPNYPEWISWELLDTFDNHIEVITNQTVQFVIFSLDNMLNFYAGRPYVTVINQSGMQFVYDDHLSQGCAAYVLVIFNPNIRTAALVMPNVTATYAPTPFLTGDCASKY